MWHKCIRFGKALHEVYKSVMTQRFLDQTHQMSHWTMIRKARIVNLPSHATGETLYNADLLSVTGSVWPLKLYTYGISA